MPADEADAAVARARQLVDLGRFEQALAILGPVLGQQPEHAEASIQAGIALINTDRAGQAMGLLQRAAAAAPSDCEPLRLLSFALLRVGRDRDALNAAQRAVELSPSQPECLVQLARALVVNHHDERALATARRAVELAPHSADAHLCLSETLVPVGRKPPRDAVREALQHTGWVLGEYPDHAEALNEWARVQLAAGRPVHAATALSSAVRADPSLDAALHNLGVAFGALVWRGHLGVWGAWVVSRLSGSTRAGVAAAAPAALVLSAALAGAALIYVYVGLRRAVPRHLVRYLRVFLQRQPARAIWGLVLIPAALAMCALVVAPPAARGPLQGLAGMLLLVGAILSWIARSQDSR